MDDALLDVVLERLEKFPLADRASSLLLSALDGDEALAKDLDSQPGTERSQRQTPTQADKPAAEPVGAYLRSLRVSGFRGIGPAATLEVPPGPGLTLVVGRNGSGKSSFAEALEVLLTGTLMRWESAKSVVFRDGWQSKHAVNGTAIKAEFLIEGKGKATAARIWPPGASIGAPQESMQLEGAKQQAGLDGLGWANDLTTYRPFLSHAELEAFFGTPHELHDLLASVLGLDELTNASVRLNTARKERDDELGAVKKRLEPILASLRALDDERATVCLTALSGRAWNIPAARATSTGGGPPSEQLGLLRQLERLAPPSASDVSAAVAALRSAADRVDSTVGTSGEQARQLAQLLDAAVEHYQTHGDGDCPVCGRRGALTEQWREQTRQHLERLREEARTAEEAIRSARNAADQALALIQQPPPVLAEDANGVDMAPVRAAWRAWAERPVGIDLASSPGLRALAAHMATEMTALTNTVSALAATASAELSKRDDQWTALAAAVTAWCVDAESAVQASQPVKAMKDARKWLIDATDDLRNARLEPLAERSREIWAKLRQESNVDLGAFRLSGSSTRRSVELDVAVDGMPGAALGVMSQGEVNALALSIFLPRATMTGSPFRFLVIDDPVQAMDPAKVDGLARVLADVATSRQVIVFTHDNRLAAAVRDLSIPATILEVTRRAQSAVDIRPCIDPVRQSLKDAGDLNKDTRVPTEVAQRVIPGLCRTALEAAFTQAFWRQQLHAGKTRTWIDARLAETRRQLTPVAALGISGDPKAGDRVLPTLNRWGSVFADTYQALNKSAHVRYTGDIGALITDTRKLIVKIEENLR